MLRGFRLMKRGSERRNNKSTQRACARLLVRRLGVEPLEERRLLTKIISASTEWTVAGMPYNDTFCVRNGATLTIDPGVTVQGGGLYVDDNGTGGNLVARRPQRGVTLYSGEATPTLSGDYFSGGVSVTPTLAASCRFPCRQHLPAQHHRNYPGRHPHRFRGDPVHPECRRLLVR